MVAGMEHIKSKRIRTHFEAAENLSGDKLDPGPQRLAQFIFPLFA